MYHKTSVVVLLIAAIVAGCNPIGSNYGGLLSQPKDEIKPTVVMPVDSLYRTNRPNASHFTVSDGMQPGIYLLNAAVNPSAAGYVYARVYDVKSGQRLSEDRLTRRSIRHVGTV
jgi:hypothetical protein